MRNSALCVFFGTVLIFGLTTATPASADTDGNCQILPYSSSTLRTFDIYLFAPALAAIQRLACMGYEYQEYFNTELPQMPNGSRPTGYVTATRGNNTFQLNFAGGPGSQVVVGVQRRVTFNAGQEPAIDSLQAEFVSTYPMLQGRFSPTSPRRGSSAFHLEQFYGEARVLRPVDICNNELAAGGLTRLRYPSPQCETFIQVDIVATDRNPGLAASYSIQILNGRRASVLNNAYVAMARAANAQHQADELERGRRRPVLD